MIEIQLIGATQVSTPSRVFAGRDFGGLKPRRLLEILALELGAPVTKDRLADLLWEGEPPASWTATLEGYVSLLRGRLEPGVPARASVIRTVNGGYALDRDRVSVDRTTVRELVGRARSARAGVALPLLREALELGAGELLVGSAGAGWADTARQEHLLLRVEAATAAARHALHLGQAAVASALADEALALDPMAEEACRCAMQALWAQGRTSEALRRHADLRAVLSEELGVDPTPQTQAVLQQLLREEVAPVLPLQRRGTDRPLAVAGAPERTVDLLAGAIVMALRRTSAGVSNADDDPVLLAKIEDVLRHLRGEAVLERLALVVLTFRTGTAAERPPTYPGHGPGGLRRQDERVIAVRRRMRQARLRARTTSPGGSGGGAVRVDEQQCRARRWRRSGAARAHRRRPPHLRRAPGHGPGLPARHPLRRPRPVGRPGRRGGRAARARRRPRRRPPRPGRRPGPRGRAAPAAAAAAHRRADGVHRPGQHRPRRAGGRLRLPAQGGCPRRGAQRRAHRPRRSAAAAARHGARPGRPPAAGGGVRAASAEPPR